MSYYIRKINLFVLIYIFFGFSLIVVASETDSFLAIKDNPKDSSGRINEITNNLLIDALVETNKISNCSQKQLYKSLIKRLKGNVIAGPIEKYINDVDDPLVEKSKVNLKGSIYGSLSFFQAPLLRLTKTSLGSVVKIKVNDNNLFIGSDKFGHFFTEGYVYYKKAFLKKKGISKTLKWGMRTERGKFGLKTTGVYSYADLAANYKGMYFWKNILSSEFNNQYFKCVGTKFIQIRKFDWRDYIDQAWDETLNCNRYKSIKALQKVLNNINEIGNSMNMDLTCPSKNNQCPILIENYMPYSDLIINPECKV
jgi:hypothetical protein